MKKIILFITILFIWLNSVNATELQFSTETGYFLPWHFNINEGEGHLFKRVDYWGWTVTRAVHDFDGTRLFYTVIPWNPNDYKWLINYINLWEGRFMILYWVRGSADDVATTYYSIIDTWLQTITYHWWLYRPVEGSQYSNYTYLEIWAFADNNGDRVIVWKNNHYESNYCYNITQNNHTCDLSNINLLASEFFKAERINNLTSSKYNISIVLGVIFWNNEIANIEYNWYDSNNNISINWEFNLEHSIFSWIYRNLFYHFEPTTQTFYLLQSNGWGHTYNVWLNLTDNSVIKEIIYQNEFLVWITPEGNFMTKSIDVYNKMADFLKEPYLTPYYFNNELKVWYYSTISNMWVYDTEEESTIYVWGIELPWNWGGGETGTGSIIYDESIFICDQDGDGDCELLNWEIFVFIWNFFKYLWDSLLNFFWNVKDLIIKIGGAYTDEVKTFSFINTTNAEDISAIFNNPQHEEDFNGTTLWKFVIFFKWFIAFIFFVIWIAFFISINRKKND